MIHQVQLQSSYSTKSDYDNIMIIIIIIIISSSIINYLKLLGKSWPRPLQGYQHLAMPKKYGNNSCIALGMMDLKYSFILDMSKGSEPVRAHQSWVFKFETRADFVDQKKHTLVFHTLKRYARQIGSSLQVGIPPTKWTCPLKMDHVQKKFHLPTIKFRKICVFFKGVNIKNKYVFKAPSTFRPSKTQGKIKGV